MMVSYAVVTNAEVQNLTCKTMTGLRRGPPKQVVIIGGGPAGCATALSILRNRADASLLLIDDADPDTYKVTFSYW